MSINPLEHMDLVHAAARRFGGAGFRLGLERRPDRRGLRRADGRGQTFPGGDLRQFRSYARLTIEGAICDGIRAGRWIRIERHALSRARQGDTDPVVLDAGGLALQRVRAEDGDDLTESFLQPAAAAVAEDFAGPLLAVLTPDQAEVFYLLAGLDGSSPRSVAEVCDLTGRDRNAVNYLLRKARKKLASQLARKAS